MTFLLPLLTAHGLLLTLRVEDPNSPMCDANAAQMFQPRATMPFSITVAPLNADGTVMAGKTFQPLCGPTVDTECPFTPHDGSRRYSFAIVPKNLYVPTEGETKPFFDKINQDFQTKLGNTLSLIPDDPDHPGLASIVNSQVLQFAEGAYVEGVIRFEVVSAPAQVVARRPKIRAP